MTADVGAGKIDHYVHAIERALIDGLFVNIPRERLHAFARDYVVGYACSSEVTDLVAFLQKDLGKSGTYEARTAAD